jgi:hypothetical protein
MTMSSDNKNLLVCSDTESDVSQDRHSEHAFSATRFPCCIVDKKILFWMAAAVWIGGVVACSEKGTTLLLAAHEDMASHTKWIVFLCAALGVFTGLVLGYFLFIPILKKNIDRIVHLESPRIYDCYRLRFWVFLMIVGGGGSILTNMYAEDAQSMAIIGGLDISVGLSLGSSFVIYFTEWSAFRNACDKIRNRQRNRSDVI